MSTKTENLYNFYGDLEISLLSNLTQIDCHLGFFVAPQKL